MAAPLDEVIEKVTNKITEPKQKEMVKQLLKRMFQEGQLLGEAMGISPEVFNYMESNAANLFQTGRYPEALKFYRCMQMLNPMEYKYPLGIALCLHRMQKYDEAIIAYIIASKFDITDPLPFFHIADCCLLQNNKKSALKSLQKALELCEDDPKYAKMRLRATMMVKKLKYELLSEANSGEKKEE